MLAGQEAPGSTCLCLPSTGIISHATPHLPFHVGSGELTSESLCFHSKPFTNWANSPVAPVPFLTWIRAFDFSRVKNVPWGLWQGIKNSKNFNDDLRVKKKKHAHSDRRQIPRKAWLPLSLPFPLLPLPSPFPPPVSSKKETHHSELSSHFA